MKLSQREHGAEINLTQHGQEMKLSGLHNADLVNRNTVQK